MGLMDRRRSLMQYDAYQNDYIRDGLVLFLDGLNQGNTSGRWIDVIGNRSFTLSNCTKLTNGVQFNGTSSYGTISSNNLGIPYNQGTAEFAAYYNAQPESSDGAIIYQGKYTGVDRLLIAGIRADTNSKTIFYNHRITEAGGPSHRRWWGYATNVGNHTVSLSDVRSIDNGVSLTTRIFGNVTVSTSAGFTIGYRYSSSRMYFKGTIYAIRLYNRVLSKEEMLHNQRIDNQRFGLGVDLANDFNANYIPKISLINTSDAYLRVNYTPVNGDNFGADYELSDQANTLNTFFSCGTGTYQMLAQISGDGTTGYGRFCSSTDATFTPNISYNTPYQIWANSTRVNSNSSSATVSFEGDIDGTDKNLYVFRRADLTSPFKGSIKTISVVNNNVIKLFLVPCVRKRDSIAGMYDMVSRTFYSSESNNDFTAE